RLAMGVIADVPDDTDLIYWGWNFNAHTAIEPIAGMAPCATTFGRNPRPEEIEAFQASRARPAAYRLLRALGIVCYTITPAGALRLKRHCLPVRNEVWEFPEIRLRIPNMGIDVGMANALPSLKAFACFPPLVVSLNDPTQSTIQPRPS